MGVATRRDGRGPMAEILDGKPKDGGTCEEAPRDVSELARRAVAGDRAAFARLCTHFEKAVFLTAYRLVGSEADAMEVVQNTLLRGYRSLHTYDAGRPFRTWLLAIAVNEARRLLRQRQRTSLVSLDPGVEPAVTTSGQGVDHVARAELKDALGRLPVDERTTFVLRYVEGRGPGEVAELMNVSERTVRRLCQGAKKRLRRLLGEGDGD